MKYILCLFAIVSISLNAQEKPKKVPKYKLALAYDPVCQMEMPKNLKDTLHYKNKVYGVCSSHCKNEIKKAPRKYIK